MPTTSRARSSFQRLVIVLTFAPLALALVTPEASAHKPIFLDSSNTVERVKDASVSYAAYGEFARKGEQHVITGPLTKGDPLVAEILLPDADPERSHSSSQWPRIVVTTPSGREIRVSSLRQPTKFAEPITRTNYLTVASLEQPAPESGEYRWTAISQTGGRFVMVLGKEERFGASDVVTLPRVIATVRSWARGDANERDSQDATASATSTDETLIGALDPAFRGALAVALMMLIAAIIGIATRDNSYVDIFWGPNFVAIAVAAFSAMPNITTRAWLVLGLVTIWALRLTLHLWVRKRATKGEDFRYANWREEWGRTWLIRSIGQVYMLQGLLALLVSLPILVVATDWTEGVDAWMVIGAAVWLVGMVIETIADRQVRAFVRRRAAGLETARMCTTGLWSISRHPNYLGEVIAWWGIGIIAIGTPLGWIGLIGSLSINLLIRYVSGVPMLEAAWKHRDGFAAWAEQTPVFVPWPRRRADRH
jgi:steroid 5-alpha reductase family enzyme